MIGEYAYADRFEEVGRTAEETAAAQARDFAEHDLSSLRTGIMAGSPCPVEVMKRTISDMHMTEVAAVLREHPAAYARLGGVTTMAGTVDSESHADGVGEWNVGADPVPFAEVLAGPVPVTVLPDDPVPPGAPDGLAGPVVGGLGRVPGFESPKYWDLATAGTFVDGSVATTESGTWSVDTSDDRGRLRRTGDGPVRVVTALDTAGLDEVYRGVFR